MYIDKFKTEGEGLYRDEKGNFHTSPKEFIQSGMFGFTQLGDPEANLRLIRDGLSLIAMQDDKGEGDGIKGIVKRINDWCEERKRVFGLDIDDGSFFWYWARKEGLTKDYVAENGVEVAGLPGGLTEKGKELLQDLNELFPAGNSKNNIAQVEPTNGVNDKYYKEAKKLVDNLEPDEIRNGSHSATSINKD